MCARRVSGGHRETTPQSITTNHTQFIGQALKPEHERADGLSNDFTGGAQCLVDRMIPVHSRVRPWRRSARIALGV
jgi:hypothetical protein